ERWLSQQRQGSVLVHEYEKLLEQLPLAIDEMADFLGAELDEGQKRAIATELDINSAYEKSRARKIPFEHVRRRINILLGRRVSFADDHLMLHPQHVSSHKGAIGIWRDELDVDEVAVIEQRFGR